MKFIRPIAFIAMALATTIASLPTPERYNINLRSDSSVLVSRNPPGNSIAANSPSGFTARETAEDGLHVRFIEDDAETFWKRSLEEQNLAQRSVEQTEPLVERNFLKKIGSFFKSWILKKREEEIVVRSVEDDSLVGRNFLKKLGSFFKSWILKREEDPLVIRSVEEDRLVERNFLKKIGSFFKSWILKRGESLEGRMEETEALSERFNDELVQRSEDFVYGRGFELELGDEYY
ncbi:hypothetical protein H0H92_005156 [Tricholoma furcatifolium]|nr:hypothetical protein H0H92_005156 [Tricholoma furcatifolium]